KHAEVYPGPDGFYIHDLGSSNGVIVNSAKIDNPYRLANGDRITIGSILVYFIYPQSYPQQDIEVQPPRHGGADQSAPSARGSQCPNCGTPNPGRALFCANCGNVINQPGV